MTGSGSGWAGEFVGSWRIAFRLAWRTTRRRVARSALIVSLLAVPVAAASVLVLAYSVLSVSTDQEATWRLGQADLLLSGPDMPAVLATVPAGSQVVPDGAGETVVAAGDEYTVRAYRAAAVADPLLAGAYLVRVGRAPTDPGEVALSSSLAAALDLRIGDQLSAGMPLRELTVVGIIDTPDQLSRELLIVAPEQPLSSGGRQGVLVGLPDSASGWSLPRDGSAAISFVPRSGLGASAAERALAAAGAAVVVGFASVQVLLLVGAAFAVGARRQQRELALIAAAGATGAQLARTVLANGIVLGALAGALGTGLGALAIGLGTGTLQRLADWPVDLDGAAWWQLAGVGLLAVAIGLGAALGPARAVARQSVRQALTDREVSAARVTRRLFAVGVAVAAAGALTTVWAARPAVGSAVLAAAGGGLVLLGAAACAPAAVAALAPLARRAILPVRLAVRHVARHRLRTGAAVAAICAAMAGSIGLMLYASADTSTGTAAAPNAPRDLVMLPPAGAQLLDSADLDQLTRQLPVTKVIPLQVTTAYAMQPAGPPTVGPPQVSTTVVVGGAEVIKAVTGADPGPADLAALAQGAAITFYPSLQHNGEVSLHDPDGTPITLPARIVPAPAIYHDTSVLPAVVIGEQTVQDFGLSAQPGGIIFPSSRAPTVAELTQAQSTVLAAQVRDPHAAPPAPVPLTVGAEPAGDGRAFTPMTLVLAGVSVLVTLVAGVVAVGLANAEMRDDLSTLAAVGAGPALGRAIAALQGGLIVGLGGILGVLAGLTPAAGLVALTPELTWRLPWAALTLTIVGGPVLAVALTALLTHQRPVLVRRLP